MQHLDEGTIHAWLDGQLPREEALAVEAHVAECRQCADAVAEARGLIAASSRILTALDSVPGEVVPKQPSFRAEIEAARAEAVADAAADALVPLELAARRPRRRWFNGASMAAAATILVAIGTVTVMQRSGRDMGLLASKRASEASAPSGSFSDSTAAVARAPATVPAAAPPGTKALGDERGAAAERRAGAAGGASVVVANESLRSRSDSVIAPVTVVKEAESRALYGARAASPPVSIRTQSAAQRADTAANKPVDQLAKDAKQEVQVAQQQVAADAAAKGVAAGVVKGRVTDANNIGLPDVTVSVLGTNGGVVTNAAGEFSIGGIPSGGYQLTVRRVGYQQVERSVTVAPGQTVQMDVVLSANGVALNNAVVAGAPAAPPRDTGAKAKTAAAPAPVSTTAPGAPVAATQTSAVGCYELGITAFSASRNAFLEVPRRIALDSTTMPPRADGVWFRARDLSRSNTLPNGVWRSSAPDAVELEFMSGSKTARINVSGTAGSIMRGTLQEIDRAKASGEAANVVAIRRACEP